MQKLVPSTVRSRSKGIVRTVTQGRAVSMFTAAEKDLFSFFSVVAYRGKYSRFVRTVAERLIAAEAALTPEIGFPCFYFDRDWAFLGYDRRVVHMALSFRVVAVITMASRSPSF